MLRRLLGPIRLEPVRPHVGRSYYRAVSTLDALAVIEEDPDGDPSEPGSDLCGSGGGGNRSPEMPALPGASQRKISHLRDRVRWRALPSASDLGPGA